MTTYDNEPAEKVNPVVNPIPKPARRKSANYIADDGYYEIITADNNIIVAKINKIDDIYSNISFASFNSDSISEYENAGKCDTDSPKSSVASTPRVLATNHDYDNLPDSDGEEDFTGHEVILDRPLDEIGNGSITKTGFRISNWTAGEAFANRHSATGYQTTVVT